MAIVCAGVLRTAQTRFDRGETGLHEHDQEAGHQRPNEVDRVQIVDDAVVETGNRSAWPGHHRRACGGWAWSNSRPRRPWRRATSAYLCRRLCRRRLYRWRAHHSNRAMPRRGSGRQRAAAGAAAAGAAGSAAFFSPSCANSACTTANIIMAPNEATMNIRARDRLHFLSIRMNSSPHQKDFLP